MTTSTTKARRVQAEAAPETVEPSPVIDVTYKDVTYLVSPDPMDWGMETLEKLDDGKIASALAGILGDKQYKRFKLTAPTTRDAVNLLNAISEKAGVEDSGN